jgi:hypothetical protein
MTKRQFCKAVAAANPGMSVRWIPATEEYRVTFADMEAIDREKHAYYTNDQDDLAATARRMWEWRYANGSGNLRGNK